MDYLHRRIEVLALRIARRLVMFATRGPRHTGCTNHSGVEIHNDILQLEIIMEPK